MRSVKRRFQRSLERSGVAGTLKLSAWNAAYYVRELTRSHRRRRQAKSGFDLRFGVDTDGNVELSDLEIVNANCAWGHRYQAVDPDFFIDSLNSLAIEHEKFVFVDFGSGKGRALLLASSFPFQDIVGVEFAPELDRIANQNIRGYRSETQRCHRLRSICADAAAFPIPTQPAVLYFYNPFETKVMAVVVGNIERSLRECPRDLFVLYHAPVADSAALFNRSSVWRTIKRTDAYIIYRSGERAH